MGILFLIPVDAAYISQLNQNQTFGPSHQLFIGRSLVPGDVFRSLPKFDMSAVPAGSIITNATLRLSLNEKIAPIVETLQINRTLSSFSQNTVT